jgi:hypothetical protein
MQLTDVKNIAFLTELMPFLEEDLGKQAKAVEIKIAKAIEEGSLTPEIAMSAWYEHNAYRKQIQKMRQRVLSGQSKAQTMASELEK